MLLVYWPDRAARADPFAPGQALDGALLADVASSALAFIAPNTIEAVPLSQLTLWGLRGLNTLDPTVLVQSGGGTMRLFVAERPILALDAPPESDARAWGELAARLIQAAWNGSEVLRRVGAQRIVVGFFDEMFSHLDPYSRYVPPREATAERNDRRGRVEVGLTVAVRDGAAIVVRVVADGPAANAGLRVGEQLLSIGGQDLEGADIDGINGLLAGEEGSVVDIEVLSRNGRTRRITLARELVVPNTVTASRIGVLLLLRVSSFNRDTGAMLARELASAVTGPHPPRGIVLDLRGNRGGLLRQAAAAASTLLSSGTVVRTIGRGDGANHDYTVDGQDLAAGRPVVVLVDGQTASAAEILAAALADQGRAVVVGSATFGKGLAQLVTTLPDGGDLFVSWRRLLAPLGWPIQGLGVIPQVCTSFGEAGVRSQLAALGRGRPPMGPAVARSRAARPPLPPAEAIQIRDSCPPAEGREPDMTVARFLFEHPAAYATATIAH